MLSSADNILTFSSWYYKSVIIILFSVDSTVDFLKWLKSEIRDYAIFNRWFSMSRKHSREFSRAVLRGRGREWATLGVGLHPLSWLLSNNRLEKVPFVSVLHTSSNRLLLSNQDKGCTPIVLLILFLFLLAPLC